MSSTAQYIGAPISVTADTTPGQIILPDPANKPRLGSDQIVRLFVHESAGVTELVSDTSQTKGLTITTVAATDANFELGTWRLGEDLTLYLYASTSTAVTIIPVYESRAAAQGG